MKKVKPLIYWPGLRPVSFITKNIVKKYGEDLVFVSSPTFDKTFKEDKIEEFEKELGHKIVWLNNADDIWERREEFSDRNLIVQAGWSNKNWLKFDKYMKQKGAKIILTADNCFKGTFRQYLGAIYFRLFFKKIFDGTFITGKSSFKLMKFFGMPEEKIYTGLLGSDEDLYNFDKTIKKKNEFLFVGQLIKRKNFDILVKAYEDYRSKGGTYSFRVIGEGPMKNLISNDIIYEGFLHPIETAKKMKESKCLILPSQEDHWPTVLHEAISSGSLIMPSINCGNHIDLLENNINGCLIEQITSKEITEKMFFIESLSEQDYLKGQIRSLDLAKNFGRNIYETSFDKFVKDICDL